MRLRLFLVALAGGISALAGSHAQATSISGIATADNVFYAYITTNPNILGPDLIGSGDNWPSVYSLTTTVLTPGVTNYLEIDAINQGGPNAFIGQFSLSDTGFEFANGTQYLTTQAAYWVAGPGAGDGGTWPPLGVPFSFGPACCTGPWGNPGFDPNAQWIWWTNGDTNEAYFETAITPIGTPLPSTWLMLLSSLVGLGFLAYRATKQNAIALAPA
jgi:hypothetical protein